jgi:hypothetical protein
VVDTLGLEPLSLLELRMREEPPPCEGSPCSETRVEGATCVCVRLVAQLASKLSQPGERASELHEPDLIQRSV